MLAGDWGTLIMGVVLVKFFIGYAARKSKHIKKKQKKTIIVLHSIALIYSFEEVCWTYISIGPIQVFNDVQKYNTYIGI